MKKILNTPVRYEDIKDLRIGDVVYLTGTLVTGRDDVYHRVVHEGMKCPVDFSKAANIHAGPIIKEEPGNNQLISIGPTSSIRMEADAAGFIEKTGIRMILGKGGMGMKTAEACKKFGAIHCVYPGGCAVTAAIHVKELKDVFWRELGMPEALWVMDVEEFGPLIVSIDTEGQNLFVENKAKYAERLDECMEPIIESVKGYMEVEAK